MAIQTDPNDPHFGLEADPTSPNFGLPAPTPTASPEGGAPEIGGPTRVATPPTPSEGGLPWWLLGRSGTQTDIGEAADVAPTLEEAAPVLEKPATALAEYVKGMIPKSGEEVERAAGIPTDWTDPVQVGEFAFPWMRPGLQIPQQIASRAQQIQAAEQTPAWSQERWNAGIGTAADLVGLARMLHESLARGETPLSDTIKTMQQAPAQVPPQVVPPARSEIITPELGDPFHPPQIPEQHLPYTGQQPAAQPQAPVGGNVKGFAQTYGPGEIPAGETITPEDAWDAAAERSATRVAKPYDFVDRARTGAITPEEMGDLIYEHEQLKNAAGAAEGTPQYNELYQRAQAFAQNVLKPAENAWHRAGQTMQIAVKPDYTSETGMRGAADRMKREIVASEEAEMRRLAREAKAAGKEVEANGQKTLAAMEREYGRGARQPVKTAEQLRNQLAGTDPCVIL